MTTTKRSVVCGYCGWVPPDFPCGPRALLDRHHILPRSCAGEDLDYNRILLCGTHHNIAHAVGMVNSEWGFRGRGVRPLWCGPRTVDDFMLAMDMALGDPGLFFKTKDETVKELSKELKKGLDTESGSFYELLRSNVWYRMAFKYIQDRNNLPQLRKYVRKSRGSTKLFSSPGAGVGFRIAYNDDPPRPIGSPAPVKPLTAAPAPPAETKPASKFETKFYPKVEPYLIKYGI